MEVRADNRLIKTMENSKTIIQKVVAVDRPFALRGHVTSFVMKKSYDFAFKKSSVGHILNKIIVI